MPRRNTCPPGVWCLTPTLGFIGLVLIVIGCYLFFTTHTKEEVRIVQRDRPVTTIVKESNGDDRYTRSPEPLRFWQNGPDLRGAMVPPGAVPINVPTRGLPQAYQQMGLLKTGDQVLPLYGRQTAYRTDRYNYYTRTDTYNPVQIPLRFEKRDCMDSIGCSELMGGETIKVAALNKDANVEIYKFDGPQYIPGLV